MTKPGKGLTRSEKLLGMDGEITRRDFLNATLIGTGAMALSSPAPAQMRAQEELHWWDGYGGVGDYATSHGNMWDMTEVAHRVRDGRYDKLPDDVIETEEVYDLAIVGGGFSGLGAAHEFHKARPEGRILLLDNHNIFGGEAKENEFLVDGWRLIGPQGSNDFRVPRPTDRGYQEYGELGVPTEFDWQEWDPSRKPLSFHKDNFGFMLWVEEARSNGYFFDRGSHGVEPQWALNMWEKKLEGTPFQQNARRSLLEWRQSKGDYYKGDDLKGWLDSMSVKDYFEKVMGVGPEVTRYVDPVLAAGVGLGCDALSAYTGYYAGLPGFPPSAFSEYFQLEWLSFPGGNSTWARYYVKSILPEAIKGERNLADIATARVDFAVLDRPKNPVRMRLHATVVRVEHHPSPENAEYVWVTYFKNGKTYRVKAKRVVMASGGWMNRRVVRDLPDSHRRAYESFHYSAVLVVNVALTNWRFMYELGVTACRWFDGFGFSCNIRRPMMVGDHRPPLDPDKPTVLTFYVPFYYPGLPVYQQGIRGRLELLERSYRKYELQIREQLVRLFGGAGFDPGRDIAGIILNRWGHAYVDPQPGFYFGLDGAPAARDVIRRRFGRIAFAHSELGGIQGRSGAINEARRAVADLLEIG